jgi:hypothetical protein
MRKISTAFSRLFVGLLFIFSGFIKANDPLGFSYKLQEYFEVFHVTFLNDFAVGVAIFLCGLEIILGAALLMGLYARKVIWGLLGLIIFFTFLTFYSAYFEVVTSCGCFGDAIPLTPWQSFGKDLILLSFILILYIYRDDIKPLISKPGAVWAALTLITITGFGIGVYTVAHLPFFDFLPYKVGANIPELMKIPPGAPQDEYEIIYQLKNKQSGESMAMSSKEYLQKEIWKDTNWEIVGEPKSKLIKKGFEPKIKDLKLVDTQGQEVTALLLEQPGYQLWVVAYDLQKTSKAALERLNQLSIALAAKKVPTYFLTSSSIADAQVFKIDLQLQPEFYFADAIPLKSMVRANPGVLLMKNGVVVNKWNFRDLPSYNQLLNQYFSKP